MNRRMDGCFGLSSPALVVLCCIHLISLVVFCFLVMISITFGMNVFQNGWTDAWMNG